MILPSGPLLRLLSGAGALALAGCASFIPAPVGSTGALDAPEQSCLAFFEQLDHATDIAQVRDVQDTRIPGFPYLRTSRLLAALTDRAGSKSGYASWVEHLRALDLAARDHEVAALPERVFPLAGITDRAGVLDRVAGCSASLAQTHAQLPDERTRLRQVAEVPDDYRTVRQVIGVFPLTGWIMALEMDAWGRRQASRFSLEHARPAGRPAVDPLQLHVPPPGSRPASAAAALRRAGVLLAQAPRDPLGIPAFSRDAEEELFTLFAPEIGIDFRSEADRFGALSWIDLSGLMRPDADPYWLDVDTSVPTVYRQLAFTRLNDQVLVQLVYRFWFSERPASESGDLLAGRLDSVIWRVTLGPDGRPLLFDSLTGDLFHQFFPGRALSARPPRDDGPLQVRAFQPISVPFEQWLKQDDVAGVRLLIRGHTHQLSGLSRIEPAAPVRQPPYRMVAADTLRSLPLPGGAMRSVFGTDGLLPGTGRYASLVAWPSGMPAVGSLRQWGRQPVSLTGRLHFDDANVIGRFFRWPVVEKPSAH